MLEQLKNDVLKTAVKAEQMGLCLHRSGNFSIRDKKSGLIVITPSGANRETLYTEDICVIDSDGKILECKKGLKPSSEFLVHLAIYKARSDIFAIAHTHSKMATSFAVANKSIPAIVYEVGSCGLKEGLIHCVPYARPGTVELSENVSRYSKKGDILLLEKHGMLAMADTISEALLRAAYCEEIAQIYFNALMINNNREPKAFSVEELNAWKYPEIK